jgi:hypothetical protein
VDILEKFVLSSSLGFVALASKIYKPLELFPNRSKTIIPEFTRLAMLTLESGSAVGELAAVVLFIAD